MKKKNQFSLRFLSNMLFGISIFVFVLLFLPFLLSFLPRPQDSHFKEGMHIVIPKINAQSLVFPHIDPWNEAAYRKVLERGVAHAKGTALPGEPGMIFLFAHSSGMPWEILRQNIVFLRLDELTLNDTIYIYRDQKKYTYKVIDKKYVFPTDISFLLSEKRSVLILQTCWPIGTDWKRLLVYAREVK